MSDNDSREAHLMILCVGVVNPPFSIHLDLFFIWTYTFI
jgi:hypothetical protein